MRRSRKQFDTAPLDRIREEMRLPSLFQSSPRLHGHAFRFKIILPLLSASGEEVFTDDHLRLLHELFDRRFGGSLGSSSVAHPTWYGSYLPESGTAAVKDYHTVLYVYTRPIDAADRFFQVLKTILKTAGLIAQDEVLIERAPVWLVEGAPRSRGRPAR